MHEDEVHTGVTEVVEVQEDHTEISIDEELIHVPEEELEHPEQEPEELPEPLKPEHTEPEHAEPGHQHEEGRIIEERGLAMHQWCSQHGQ